jgi:uncharacterized membrane protein SpoIIM required for sporulation
MMPVQPMNAEDFQAERSSSWDALEALLARAKGRPERLGVDGVLELGGLYRATAADLALARRRYPGFPMLDRLEPLVLRARHAVYGERSRRGSVRQYLLRGYWREIVTERRLLAFVWIAMVTPVLLSAAWAIHDPGAAIGLVPGEYRGAAAPHVHALPEALSTQAALASTIYVHNIEVAFLDFAGGLAFGVVTLALLLLNQVLLGTLAGLTIQAGTFSVFVRYIVPHGLLELSCFSIASVAGLMLARALINPGVHPRAEVLRREARRAVQMVLATAPWLVVAGLTEGFITPRGLPLPAAIAVGVALGGVFWTLVLTRGRAPRSRQARATVARAPSPAGTQARSAAAASG